MTPIKTPTLAELHAAGYKTHVEHRRVHKVAYYCPTSGKLVIKDFTPPAHPPVKPDSVMTEMLPKGGMTEIWVTDPETSAEFYGFAKCHPEDNYNKRAGVNEALKRVAALMLVMDGTDGFKCRLQL